MWSVVPAIGYNLSDYAKSSWRRKGVWSVVSAVGSFQIMPRAVR